MGVLFTISSFIIHADTLYNIYCKLSGENNNKVSEQQLILAYCLEEQVL